MAILQNEVINYLLGLIEQSGHDAPLPSQNELRQKFACSTVTVRKALEKLEERGLIYRLQGKGCFVRRPEQKSPATRIFLIIPQGADLQGEFISSLVAASRKYSYHTLFYCYDDNEDMLFYELERVAPQVVLWLAPSIFKYGKTLQKLLARIPHVILFNREYDHPSMSYVTGDFAADGKAMGNILVDQGVSNILYVSLNMQLMFSHRRAAGISEIIGNNGGTMDIIDASALNSGGSQSDEKAAVLLKNAILKAVQQKEYSAIVGAQGKLWDIILQASKEAPNADKLILGNFNILPPQQICTNPAVIMEQPIAMMADEAIKLVTRLLNNGKPEQLVFGSEVILAPQQKAVAN